MAEQTIDRNSKQKYKSLVGDVFHYLTVVSEHGRTKSNIVIYKCLCKCGNETLVPSNLLRKNNTKSCGCWREENMGNQFRTHGLSHTRIYKIWGCMNERCYNEKNTSYGRYGALGIRVCEKWHSFEGFYEDMKEGYSDNLTIERIISAGNYEKSNCKWATYQEQNENRKNIRFLTINGETKKIIEWSKISGTNSKVIRIRLDYYGWDPYRAVFTPSRNKNGRKSNK